LNSATSAQIASDKAAAYAVLANNGLPAVPHHIFRFLELDLPEWTAGVLRFEQLPIVIKPHVESGGIDVHRAASLEELTDVLTAMARRYRAIAVSPYVEIEEEYRVVVLDDQVEFCYRKVRRPGTSTMQGRSEWRHNLRLGATPELIDHEGAQVRLASLARAAMAGIGLRFAAVDIVAVDHKLMVLEVNSAVTLEHFSRHSSTYAALAANVYRHALGRCFGEF